MKKLLAALLVGIASALSGLTRRLVYRQLEWLGAIRYAAHTAVAAHTDALYYISAGLPATYDAAGYGATTITWTLIGKVQNFMPYGSKRAVNTFKPIAGAAEYLKGTPEYGQGDLVCGDVPADVGQVILKAAEASANHYSMKIVYPDTETHYIDVLNSGWVLSGGEQGAPMIRTATLNICKAPVIVAAT